MSLTSRIFWRCPVCGSRTWHRHTRCRVCGSARSHLPPFPSPEDLDAEQAMGEPGA